jgi:hypothetical protein
MVAIRGGGQTYQVGNGKHMEWEQVPDWFKSHMDLQERDAAGDARCVELRAMAQKCMSERGAYDPCAAMADAYHHCVALALRVRLDQTPVVDAMAQQQQQQK